MTKYRKLLPQLSKETFLTDGGLETTLIFQEDYELPHFAAFDLLKNATGKETLKKYYHQYLDIAKRNQLGFILESATWRASEDWGEKLGYTAEGLTKMNQLAIQLLADIRSEYGESHGSIVVSGCVGPRGDGYNPVELMTIEEAERYHTAQVKAFSESEADMICAVTMTNIQEAIGICQAATKFGLPIAISFTVETDGRLPTGQTLRDAIISLDEATNNAPAYYMINCAHPSHFDNVLDENEPWVKRIHGLRANASTKSHAELDEAEELDDGNPDELGHQYQQLKSILSNLNVLGGCCGTDHRHVEKICTACSHS